MTSRAPTQPLRRHALSTSRWRIEDSSALYQIEAWGQGYYAINSRGHVVARPEKRADSEIDLLEVIENLGERGLHTPVLLRFSNMLTHRLHEMHAAFQKAIEENEYPGDFFAVYPIKVNQQRAVVEEVYRYGADYRFGLEVGSKPELLAVMAMASDADPRLIVCNGFKDADYLETVVVAAKLGRSIVAIIEKPDELPSLFAHAARHGVRPRIGVRVKLAGEGVGRWGQSAGARSKFGLFASEVLELFDALRSQQMEDCLELVHCHVGSQLHDIRRVKDAVGELARFYVELEKRGATGLRFLDVGGGLGVDYDGSRSNEFSSMNYSLDEYASEIVYRVGQVCSDADVTPPTIITESGRAMTAYQSLLVIDVLGRSGLGDFDVDEDLDRLGEDDSLAQPVLDLIAAARELEPSRILECYHDSVQAHAQALELFTLGYLSLDQRAFAERLFWNTCRRVLDLARRVDLVTEELETLEVTLADTYFCNFSLFQSLPDNWAIDQLFPIMPIHRLGEPPSRSAVLADITCDSDGKIDRFSDRGAVRKALPLHSLDRGDGYYLGVFLVGAYQEVLGCLHNLFGDTHVVHLELDDEGWRAQEIVAGDTAAEVLSYLQYDIERLEREISGCARRAVADGRLREREAESLLEFYRRQLGGYTYLGGG